MAVTNARGKVQWFRDSVSSQFGHLGGPGSDRQLYSIENVADGGGVALMTYDGPLPLYR